MSPFPLAGPSITEKEIAYVTDAVTTNWQGKANDYIGRFETAFAALVRRRYAIALPSCTSGLHLALAALDLGPGDEVIVPDLTWIATAAPIAYVGATPIFADVDRDSWCLSLETVKAVATERTKAIIAVGLYGQMPDFDPLLAWAEERGIAVIEDGAESLGSAYKGRPAGNFGRASAFSFHGSKTLSTGEGGMLVMDDEAFHNRCRFLADHGRKPGDVRFLNSEVAFKYKMSSMQAALGLAQVERAAELVAKKKELFSWYRENLDGIPLNPPQPHVEACPWMTTALFEGHDKFALMAALTAKGIQTRPFFSPLSSLEAYAGSTDARRARRANRTAYSIAPTGLNLPSAHDLGHTQVLEICRAVKEVIAS